MGGTLGWVAAIATVVAIGTACGSGAGPPVPSASGDRGAGSGSSVAPSPISTPAPAPKVALERIGSVDHPVAMATRPGEDALYLVGKKGRVWALRDGRVASVLDITGSVSLGGEQGLLGLAFDPSGSYAYIQYTDPRGDIHIDEYAWRRGRADPSTRRRILFLRKQFPNHNGGDLVFGPDGYLYVGLGDGGSDYTFGDPQGDPYRHAQDLGSLFGKMLRIEPRLPDGSVPPHGAAYVVPDGNPFVGRRTARPEIWAYGLRNPWRYSFDRESGDLWIADVGAGAREEVDVQPAGSPGGRNYGWNALEGTVVYRNPPRGAVPPVYEYAHTTGGCAVIGGFVYRGALIPDLRGWYVYGDACIGAIDVLRLTAGGPPRVYVAAGQPVPQLSSFGQDSRGELYAMSLGGEVFRLVAP